jgi:hypothetical protein
VLVPTAAVALATLAPLTYAARSLRLTTQAGVVVVPEVFLTDEAGVALWGDPLPEAAAVEVGERQGARYRVRWGATEGWVPVGSVRVVGR